MEVRSFSGSLISSQRDDHGKIFITLSLGIRLECCKKWSQVQRWYKFELLRKMDKIDDAIELLNTLIKSTVDGISNINKDTRFDI